MVLFQQLRNLLYATVVTSWQHLPHFFPLLGMALVLVVLFLGGALLFTNKKNKYLLLSYYYVVIAGFVILVDVLARVGVNYSSAILGFGALFSLVSLFGFWKKRDTIISWLKKYKTEKIKWILLLFVTVLSTFFFSKFIYGNGLHDEYQHHAVVEDMLQTGQWPIRDELRYKNFHSDSYHYGWYYLVILVVSMFQVSIETALDIVKIILFIPLIPFLSALLSTFLQTKWYQSLALSVALLVLGPGLFFFDAYTGNIFFSQGNEVIYEPLFFQLAGVTWFGMVLMVAFISLAVNILQKSQILVKVIYILFSLWSLFLLNKAYLLVYLPILLTIVIWVYKKNLNSFCKKRKKALIISLPLLFVLVVFGYWILNYISPPLYTLLKGNGEIPFLRPIQMWGFPFSSSNGLAFKPVFSLGSLRAFGLFPILSVLVLIRQFSVKKQRFSAVLLLSVYCLLWFTPVLLNFSGSELALNKYYIPALWLSVLVVIKYALSRDLKSRFITFLLVFSSVVAPLAYFVSIYLPGSHIYWNYNDPIIEYLDQQNSRVVTAIDDYEYGKFLINNVDIQLVSVNTPNIDIAEIVEYEVTTTRRDDEPLAQTDTHYLYAK